MPFQLNRRQVLALTVVCGFGSVAAGTDRTDTDFFESRIRPVLVEHCVECHSIEHNETAGDYRLDDAASMRRGGLRGPAIVAGTADQSPLIAAIEYEDDDLQMPPAGRLPAEVIEDFRRWIDRGATDPRPPIDGAPDARAADGYARSIADHWALRPPTRLPPARRLTPLDVDPIDSAVGRIATAAGLKLAPPAGREVWLRRLHFDLTGLPPTAEQLAEVQTDPRPDWQTRWIDRLIADPGYAERMTRHWMDVARYADTVGYALANQPREIEGSHTYRDWLLAAFGDDRPFGEFVKAQIAGDRMPEPADRDAMGFITIGRQFLNGHDRIDDRIDVVTRGLLGLTVTCARCHDHKFDPIPTVDYYRLYGIFHRSEDAEDPEHPLALRDAKSGYKSKVFRRGNAGDRGDVADPGFPVMLASVTREPFGDGAEGSPSGRWELATAIASDQNPLTHRVYVNRVWAHLIGRPIVDTPSDFGVRTARPALAPVLDDLAAEFRDVGSTQRLVRRIVRCRVYGADSVADPAAAQIDPDNALASHAARRRRDFESLRDSMLAVAGQLDRRVGGVSVAIDDADLAPRRTVYAHIDRQNPPSLFRIFNVASADAHVERRHETTVPQQSLFLINDPMIASVAAAVADRGPAGSDDAYIRWLHQQILRRPAPDRVVAALTDWLAGQPDDVLPPHSRRWSVGRMSVDDDGDPTGPWVPLTVFKKDRYVPAMDYPDQEFGHLAIDARGGHPGRQHAAVIRWVAPEAGKVHVRFSLNRPSDKGDGVIYQLRRGDEVLHRRDAATGGSGGHIDVDVQPGDAIDWIVAAGPTDSYDGYRQELVVEIEGGDGRRQRFDFATDFGHLDDPPPVRLGPRAQLAQVLLMSNEFAFVD